MNDIERIFQIVELSTDSISLIDTEGNLRHVNSAACSAFAFERPLEAIGTSWIACWPHASRAMLSQAFAAAMNGESTTFSALIEDSLDEEQWCSLAVHPLRDKSGHIDAIVSIRRDMTEHVSIQRALQSIHAQRGERPRLSGGVSAHPSAAHELAEHGIREAQKHAAIGQMVAGIAHDFSNMLQTAIVGLSTVLDRPDNLEPMQRRILGFGLESVHDAAMLSRRLLAFSRTHRYEAMEIDLAAVIEGTLDLARHCVGAGMDLRYERRGTPPPVWADPHAVEQAFINLCLNARDACSDATGVVTITVGDLTVGPDTANSDKPLGTYIALTVVDDGSGMTEETQRRLFEPYFTTKPEGKGAGLGLTQVYGAVRQAGGFIDISSELGAGSSVTLAFPLHKTLAAMPASKQDARAA